MPHLSFVQGESGVNYLRKRYAALRDHHCFAQMDYSEERATLQQWMPLMMRERDNTEALAATRVALGTDVNFGALTLQLLRFPEPPEHYRVSYKQQGGRSGA